MGLSIEEYCRELLKKEPDISPAEMMHNLHEAGYDREKIVLAVKQHFSDLTAAEMCSLIVAEYAKPLVEKEALKKLLLSCGYEETDIEIAIEKYYPKSLGYVMMLDDSCSMHDASNMIKIDAKAFLDSTRTNDQFGVNIFETSSSWLYPEGEAPAPATVTEGRAEMNAAKKKIDTLQTSGFWTNIGAAVYLGNQMVSKMNTDMKAFVLLSDGASNTGESPASVLQAEPPIYIAGLGPQMQENNFKDMLAKNPKSKFYNSPDAYMMMQIFNQIIADSTGSALALNNLVSYQGTNYSLLDFTIAGRGNCSSVCVVWSDKKYRYTNGYPDQKSINIVLIDPKGVRIAAEPVISEDGYCIFELRNVRPGVWHVLAQYAVDSPLWATVGVIEFASPVGVEVSGSQFAVLGESVPYKLEVSNASLLKKLSVDAVYSMPAMDFKKIARERFGMEKGEAAFPLTSGSLFPRTHCFGQLSCSEPGLFHGVLDGTEKPGIYNVYLTAKGKYVDGTPFVCRKMHSVIVEDVVQD